MKTAAASGFSSITLRISSTSTPMAIPISGFTFASTYTGMPPQSTSALMTLLCTFLGRIILSPALQTDSIMLCTELVVPFTIKKACAAPKASAVSSSALRITDTGCPRLSSGFMEFTSSPTHFSPSRLINSGFPRPLLCPGTSNGTTRIFRKRSNAS